MPGGGVGSIIYLSDSEENAGRVSQAGRLFISESYSRVKTHSPLNVSAESGGTQFETVAVGKVYLKSESGNSVMWIGGTGDDAPYSGHGFPIYGGERSPDLFVTNFNAIRVCASVSGEIIYPIGFLDGVDATLPNTVTLPPPSANDLIPPFVVSHSPTSGFSGVALNAEITATFNETIATGSIVSGVFRLSPAHNVTLVRDAIDFTKIVMQPNVNLSGSTVYMAELISGGVTDLAGNWLSGKVTFPFTTTTAPPPPDSTPPVVSGTSPANGATNVDVDSDITITFSEQMLSGTINTSGLYLSKTSGGTVNPTSYAVTLAVDNKVATINPTVSLDSSTYYINVTTQVKDLAGNAIAAADKGRNFSTAYNFTEVYNVTGNSNSEELHSVATFTRAGLKILNSSPLIGVVIKKIVFSLAKSGSPTGTATVNIRNSSNTIVATIGTIDVSTLTTSQTDYTFTDLTQTHTLASSDRITIDYNGGDISNFILVYYNTADTVSFVEFTRWFSSGGWFDIGSQEFVAKLYT